MIDSSVLVAAFYRQHPHFDASHRLLQSLPAADRIACVHSLAEIYAAVTRLPIHPRPAPHAARQYIDSLSKILRWVAISAEAYQAALSRVTALQLPGAKIYDALLLEVALERRCDALYTWNIKDFELLAGDAAIRILRPE